MFFEVIFRQRVDRGGTSWWDCVHDVFSVNEKYLYSSPVNLLDGRIGDCMIILFNHAIS